MDSDPAGEPMTRRRAKILLLAVTTLGCAQGPADSTADLRREVEAAVARLVDLLGLENPVVNVWGEACPPRDDRFGPCDELGAYIEWPLTPEQQADRWGAVIEIVETLSNDASFREMAREEPQGIDMCFEGLPGAIYVPDPEPVLSIQLASDKSQCG